MYLEVLVKAVLVFATLDLSKVAELIYFTVIDHISFHGGLKNTLT